MPRHGYRRSSLAVPMRLCLVLLTIIWPNGCQSRATETLSPQSQQHQQPGRKTLDQEIGSPSELAWQAWLLVENKHGPGQSGMLDSSNILRRITPKSIFIAPEVNCPDGWKADGRGGCKPDPISVDEEAQKLFYLKRLNAKYHGSSSPATGSKKKPQEINGPLQINIPIFTPNRRGNEPAKQQHTQSQQVDRLAIPVVISQQPIEIGNKSQEPTVAVVVYKVENATRPADKDGPMLFLGNSSSAPAKKDGQVLQVAEIEMNDTFAGVVDYKIPIGLEPFNKSIEDQTQQPGKSSAEDSSPTVVLLLSPTSIPITTSSQKTEEAYDRLTTRSEPESTTIQPTEAETRLESDATIQTVAPLGLSSEITDSTGGNSRTTEPAFTQEDESAYTDYSQTEQESEDEDEAYDDRSTEPSEQDEFAESEDELLKPGEAGMMLSAKNQDIMKSQKQSTLPADEPTSTTLLETTTLTSYPTDALDSTTKTEPTDYTVREQETTSDAPSTTTLSDETTSTFETRPWRLRTTIRTSPPVTQAPVLTTIKIKDATDQRELFDTDLVTEPEVILSTQGSYGRKQPSSHPAKILYGLTEEARTESPELYRRERPQLTVNNEPIFFKNEDTLPQEFRDQLAESSRPLAQPERTYVRFPESASRVRFPSDEVNSIHSQGSYKDHLLSPYRSSDSATSTKSSVPARQKQANSWRLPVSRTDRQQANQRQQKQKPMLLRFWARMPLVRDLSFYPTTSHGSHNEPIGGHNDDANRRINSRFPSPAAAAAAAAPRRVNYYKEMASHDVNRRLAQQLGQPAIGG